MTGIPQHKNRQAQTLFDSKRQRKREVAISERRGKKKNKQKEKPTKPQTPPAIKTLKHNSSDFSTYYTNIF